MKEKTYPQSKVNELIEQIVDRDEQIEKLKKLIADKVLENKNQPTVQAPPFATFGWVCPVCGAGNSPFASHCPCVTANKPITWTSDNSSLKVNIPPSTNTCHETDGDYPPFTNSAE